MTCSINEMLAGATAAEDTVKSRGAALDKARNANAQVVHALFERYRERLLRYLTGLLSSVDDAEDIVQETYARLLETASLDSAESRVRAYIFKIATNLAYDRFRARRVRGSRVPFEESEFSDGDLDPGHIVGFDQCLAVIKQTLLDLRPRCRQVFLLRTSEQLTYQEIAKRLGISTRTVEREMRHAIDLCQRRLQIGKRT